MTILSKDRLLAYKTVLLTNKLNKFYYETNKKKIKKNTLLSAKIRHKFIISEQ